MTRFTTLLTTLAVLLGLAASAPAQDRARTKEVVVAFTLWASKTSPLWNFTFRRSANSHVVSLTTFQPVASIGDGL